VYVKYKQGSRNTCHARPPGRNVHFLRVEFLLKTESGYLRDVIRKKHVRGAKYAKITLALKLQKTSPARSTMICKSALAALAVALALGAATASAPAFLGAGGALRLRGGYGDDGGYGGGGYGG